ncbi:Hypothetical predicted protein [Mytilus galloprovincialis]|uniref:Uncharacterized protein n=1 Tax=Mytilus galloprovincialis TaxID=29158 RepID=A0A8B6EGE4_MYTGA|nr:Hypothetical predicted protein [Mytilus galloprovincialis]
MASWDKDIMASWDKKTFTAAEKGNIKEVELCVKNGASLECRKKKNAMARQKDKQQPQTNMTYFIKPMNTTPVCMSEGLLSDTS